MKKLMILAMSVLMVASMSAQELKAVKAENRKDKKEFRMNKEQRVEMDIKYLTEELYLSDEQAAKFAVTYKEFVAAKEKLNKEFAAKFGKDLNERQVKAVLRYHGPKQHGQKGECQKAECQKGKEGCEKREGRSLPKRD